jgi:hypothetical protein
MQPPPEISYHVHFQDHELWCEFFVGLLITWVSWEHMFGVVAGYAFSISK